MKHFIIAALCLLSLGTKAQVQFVTVTNYNNCDVYFTLEGCSNSSGCSNGNISAQYTFVAGQQQTFDGTALGLTTGDNIVIGNVFDADVSLGCSPVNTWQVSDVCWSTIASVTYTVLNSSCTPCGAVNAVWTPTSATTANLDFY